MGWLLVIGVLLACAGLMWSDRITERTLEMSWAAVFLAVALLVGAQIRPVRDRRRAPTSR